MTEESLTQNIKAKKPIILFLFIFWAIVTCFFLVTTYSNIFNSVQGRFVEKLGNQWDADPENDEIRIAYWNARESLDQITTPTLLKNVVEIFGLGLGIILMLSNKRAGSIIALIAIIFGLILDIAVLSSNILIINAVGFILILIVNNKMKDYIRKKKEVIQS